MKKIIALLLTVMMCAGIFAACSTLGENDKGAEISVYLTSFPSTLDPAAPCTDAGTAKILALLYEPLTKINEDGKLEGCLSYEWYPFYDKRDDLYKIFFKLNETKWNDGRPVSADDVVYAWKRILAPEFNSPYASLLFSIKNARAYKNGTDGKTSDDLGVYAANANLLEVVFEKKFNGPDDPEFKSAVEMFAYTVSDLGLSPMREDIITKSEKDMSEAAENSKKDEQVAPWYINAAKLPTNGPFRLQNYTDGKKLVLERNIYYFRDEKEDALDKSVIPYRFVCIYNENNSEKRDPVTQTKFQSDRFNANQIFYLNDFDIETFKAYKDKAEIQKTLATYNYYFNTGKDILKDAKVRRALSAALDRNEIVKLTGDMHEALKGFVPSLAFDTDRKTSYADKRTAALPNADVNLAKDLLKQAGVKGGDLKLNYVYPVSEEIARSLKGRCNFNTVYENIANYAKGVWEGLGFKVTVEGVYPEKVAEKVEKGDFDIIGLDCTTASVDPMAYIAGFASKYCGSKVVIDFEDMQPSYHFTGFNNADFEKIIDENIYNYDKATRAEGVRKAEAMLFELAPAAPLFSYNDVYVAADSISGIKSDYYGHRDFRKVKLDGYIEINQKEAADSEAAEKK